MGNGYKVRYSLSGDYHLYSTCESDLLQYILAIEQENSPAPK